MNDIFANVLGGLPQFFNTFSLAKFLDSIQGFLFAFYIIISSLLALKVYRDANRRFNDKLLVLIITVIVFGLNIIGYLLYSILKPKEYIHDQHMQHMENYFLEYETRGIGKCKICKHVYFPEHTYCVNCGNLVRTKCSSCANIIELDWKVCPYCGDNKRIEIDRSQIALSNNSVKGIEIIK